MRKLEMFEPECEPRLLVGGGAGSVFKISDRHVAKFGWWAAEDGVDDVLPRLDREYELGRDLYDCGISVPEQFGVFNIPLYMPMDWRFKDGGNFPAIVMGYIPGDEIIDPIKMGEMISLRDTELRKAQDLGFGVGRDAHKLANAIFRYEKKSVHLIDFGLWRNREGRYVNGNLWNVDDSDQVMFV